MFAIAANSFNQLSETFIRSHIRDIAPEHTILLCQDGVGSEALRCPVLSNITAMATPLNFRERLANSFHFRWRKYIDPALSGSDEKRVRSFLQTYGPKALLAEYGPNGCLLHRACLNSNVPLYVHFHGFDGTKLLRYAHIRRHYRVLFRDAAGIIVPSHFLADQLRKIGCPQHKLHISPYGINIAQFEISTRLEGSFIAVGRLVEKKAPHLTIRAFSLVAREVPNVKLNLIGDGPLRSRCEDEISRYKLQDRVVMHGAVCHSVVQQLMSSSSVFLQHSVESSDGDCEGLPVAILEAMAAGLPVVSTKHSGIPEAVIDGETGLLVPENDVEGMASAMLSLLRDPKGALQMGRAGQVRIEENFTHIRTAERLREIMRLKC